MFPGHVAEVVGGVSFPGEQAQAWLLPRNEGLYNSSADHL